MSKGRLGGSVAARARPVSHVCDIDLLRTPFIF